MYLWLKLAAAAIPLLDGDFLAGRKLILPPMPFVPPLHLPYRRIQMERITNISSTGEGVKLRKGTSSPSHKKRSRASNDGQ